MQSHPTIGQLKRYKDSVPFSETLNDLVYKIYMNLRTKINIRFIDCENPYVDFDAMRVAIDGGHLLVSSQHCENTIFGSPQINMAFRAVHDYLHYHHKLTFSYEDELSLNYIQNYIMKSEGASQYDLDLLNIETAGQIVHHKQTGEFPKNQRNFTIEQLILLGY